CLGMAAVAGSLSLFAAQPQATKKPATPKSARPAAPPKREPSASAAPPTSPPPKAVVAKTGDPVEFESRGMNLVFGPVRVATMTVSPDGKWLVAGTGFFNKPGELVLWDVAARKVKWSQRYDIGIRSVALSPDGKLIASGHFDTRTRITNASTGEVAATLAGHTGGINSIAFAPDGKSLVTGSLDKTIKIWDMKTHDAVRNLFGHGAGFFWVAAPPGGRRCASGSRDGSARLWNFDTGDELHSLEGHDSAVEMVAFAPKAPLLATAGW